MLEEEKAGAVSEAEAVSQPEGSQEIEKKPEPLTEAKVAEMLATEVEKVKTHFQSVSDKAIANANREARDARKKSGAAEAGRLAMKETLIKQNPRAKQSLDLADSQARLNYYDNQAKEDEVKRGEEAHAQQFYGTLREDIKSRGINPDDKRIDWAEGEDSYTAMKKVLTSVAKIQKEDEATSRTKFEQQMDDKFAQLRKDAGLDSADTTAQSSKDYGTGGLNEVLGGAKDTREAHQKLQEFIKGA